MLPSCSRVTAQNLAEFAQNLEICTHKLEKSYSFTIIHVFCMFFFYFFLLFGYFYAFLNKMFKV